jgi:chromate transporter
MIVVKILEWLKLQKTKMIEVIKTFLKLGVFGFGGPAAHLALIEEEIVNKKKWITREKLIDLIGITNIIPGPNSTEVVIHIGYLRAGWRGLIAAGLAFIVPAALITTAFAYLYVEYGSLPDAAWFLNGIKPAVIAIITGALFRLIRTGVKKQTSIMAFIFAFSLNMLGVSELILLFASGALIALWDNKSKIINSLGGKAKVFIFPLFAFMREGLKSQPDIVNLGLYFLKIGSILYGSGYVLIAFLQGEIVGAYGWITTRQLLDAVAVGQFTPGPLLATATFIGYIIHGALGAAVATIGVFLPSFIFVAILARYMDKVRQNKILSSFLDGLNGGSLGLMGAVLLKLAMQTLTSPAVILIFIIGLILLIYFKLSAPLIIIAGAALSYGTYLLI